MGRDDDVSDYLSQLNDFVVPLATAADGYLVNNGCNSYVKTIYIGYEIDGEMVAALYGHSNHIEMALALPEDAEGAILIDATHLTWRTLPVAAVVKFSSQLGDLELLIDQACSRVRSQQHDVLRPPEFFMEPKRGQFGHEPNSSIRRS